MEQNLKEKLPFIFSKSLAASANIGSLPLETLTREKHVDALCAHYIWKNGSQSVFLCPKALEKGAIFSTKEEALKTNPGLAPKLQELEKEEYIDSDKRQIFSQAKDSVVLFIPKKMCQKREFLLDLELSDTDRAAVMDIFVLIDADASAVVTLNLHSRGSNAKNTCAVLVHCQVGKNAHLVLNEVQDFGLQTVCVRQERTIVEEGGDLHWNICELGSAEAYDTLGVQMIGENSSAVVYGLYFPVKDQKMHMETRQDHLVPHTFSNLHYKGALADHASARWEGMIYVDPKAEKTDGYQKNENLMLSDEAEIFAKPGLEIITDDVKCSHGTTITNIDDDQIFYLTSRGISEKEAEKLVIRGFFDTILNSITYSPIRGKLQDKIGFKMQEGE